MLFSVMQFVAARDLLCNQRARCAHPGVPAAAMTLNASPDGGDYGPTATMRLAAGTTDLLDQSDEEADRFIRDALS